MEHSEDYSEPFGDHIGRYTLCYRCHMLVHCRFTGDGPRAWEEYRSIVRHGGRVALPYPKAMFGTFARQHLSGQNIPAHLLTWDGIERDLLDRIDAGVA